MRAFSLLPSRFEDKRHESFKTGIRKLGFDIVDWGTREPERCDLVLGWNAYGPTYDRMRQAQERGARSLVFEEAYVRRIQGEKYFACALDGHNGYGNWRIGGSERLDSWSLKFKPFRIKGTHILVCGQRGFGYNEMAMPNDWPDTMYTRLRDVTDRPLWFRPHPKRRATMPKKPYDRILDFNVPLENHLSDAWACVVWTSNSATVALQEGVPVFYDGPAIVTAGAAVKGIETLEHPVLKERKPSFVRMSWAQWSVEEFENGTAFEWLLN